MFPGGRGQGTVFFVSPQVTVRTLDRMVRHLCPCSGQGLRPGSAQGSLAEGCFLAKKSSSGGNQMDFLGVSGTDLAGERGLEEQCL